MSSLGNSLGGATVVGPNEELPYHLGDRSSGIRGCFGSAQGIHLT